MAIRDSRARVAQWFAERPRTARLVAGGVLVLVVGVDVARLIHQAHALPEGFGDDAFVLGYVVAVGTVGYAMALSIAHFSGRLRSPWFWPPVWLGLVPFGLAHPRRGGDDLSALGRFSLAFSVLVLVLAPMGVLVTSRVRRSQPTPEVAEGEGPCSGPCEVWLVQDSRSDTMPYFIASCGCGWVGRPYDQHELGCEATAFGEARAHTSNVVAAVRRPLD